MGLIDNLKDKAQELLNDPETKIKIEQIAKDNGISIEAAKEKFLNKDK